MFGLRLRFLFEYLSIRIFVGSLSVQVSNCQVPKKVDSFYLNHLSAKICEKIRANLREISPEL